MTMRTMTTRLTMSSSHSIDSVYARYRINPQLTPRLSKIDWRAGTIQESERLAIAVHFSRIAASRTLLALRQASTPSLPHSLSPWRRAFK